MLTARNEGGDFVLVPAGVKVARCFRVVDLGTQYSERWSKSSHKVMVAWEFPKELMEDGKPFSIANWYTVSLHEKSNMRKDLESWRGRGFTETELLGFDLSKILGQSCYINVVHNVSDNKTYANVASIMPLPDGVECPEAVNPLVAFDIDEFDQEVFDALPEGLQKIINTSEERTGQTHGQGQMDEDPPPHDEDDIPF
jgi:hypothetical protein